MNKSRRLEFVKRLSTGLTETHAALATYYCYRDELIVSPNLSGLYLIIKFYGWKKPFEIIFGLLSANTRKIKLTESFCNLGIIKPHVFVALDKKSNQVCKYYDCSQRFSTQIQEYSLNAHNALLHLNSIPRFANWVPSISRYKTNEDLKVGWFEMELISGGHPPLEAWKGKLVSLVSVLAGFYLSSEVELMNWKENDKLNKHYSLFRNWFMKHFKQDQLTPIETTVLVHGDFQHFNILYEPSQHQLKIIDWGGYRRGVFYDAVVTTRFYHSSQDVSPVEEQLVIRKSRFFLLLIDELERQGLVFKDYEIVQQLAMSQYRRNKSV